MPTPSHDISPELWVKKYSSAMYSYALARLGGDQHAAQDIVQETFLSALKSIASFRGLASEKTWLYAILRHRIADFYQHSLHPDTISFSTMKHLWALDKTSWEEQIPSHEENPLSALEHKEQRHKILLAIASLPKQQRRIFILKYIRNMNSREICQLCDISIQNYWVLIHRARQNLRKLLSDEK